MQEQIFYGISKSTDNGVTWFQTALNNRTVYSLVVSGSNIYAGTSLYGLYISSNNGDSWIQTSLILQIIYSMYVNGNNIYCGTDQGVYISSNNGANWTPSGFSTNEIYSICVTGGNIYAGVSIAAGVYKSTNNGVNWTQTSLNNRVIYSLYGEEIMSMPVRNNYGLLFNKCRRELDSRLLIILLFILLQEQEAGIYAELIWDFTDPLTAVLTGVFWDWEIRTFRELQQAVQFLRRYS
ncbi:MAG: exo-alpha-sialidase [Ignavibacteria bacterium]|nr:exo-alpha-sialidase [Ignavibacteria bacterium]